MKISEIWLREFVSTDLSREEIAEELTMLGWRWTLFHRFQSMNFRSGVGKGSRG